MTFHFFKWFKTKSFKKCCYKIVYFQQRQHEQSQNKARLALNICKNNLKQVSGTLSFARNLRLHSSESMKEKAVRELKNRLKSCLFVEVFKFDFCDYLLPSWMLIFCLNNFLTGFNYYSCEATQKQVFYLIH